MKALTRRLRKTRTGQVVVEMLLILPVFLTIVFTIMEMGQPPAVQKLVRVGRPPVATDRRYGRTFL